MLSERAKQYSQKREATVDPHVVDTFFAQPDTILALREDFKD